MNLSPAIGWRACGSRFGAILLVVLSYASARAAHYAGGAITYTCLGGNNYEVTLNLFRDCNGFNMVPQSLTFSNDCGLTFTVNALPVPPGVEVSQLCPSQLANSSCNGGALPGMQHYQFTTIVNLPPCDDWTISWNICCWTTSQNVVATPQMYLEATLDNLTAPCNSSPVFNDQSIPYVCVNQPVYYNYGVTEPDGDSIVYGLVGAQTYSGGPLPITYQAGFSGTAPVGGAMLDPQTGQLTFLPTITGNYIVAVQVSEYDASGVLIGTVLREQLFVVMNCTGSVPVVAGLSNNTGGILTGPNTIQVCDGQAFCVDMVFTDADPGTVLTVTSNAAALLPGCAFSISGTNPATATLCWTGDAGNTPVNVLVEANDGACPVMNNAGSSINVITVTGGIGPLDPGVDAMASACSSGPIIDLFTLLGGTPDPGGSWLDPAGLAHSGLFDPAIDLTGAYAYVIGNACSNASATVTVSVQVAPDAGTNGSLTTCSTAAPFDLFALLGGAPAVGGSWTGPGGAPHSNLYDPAVDAPGAYDYTVAGAAPCGSAMATVTIAENTAPNAGIDGALAICSTGMPQALMTALGGSPSAGGTWAAPGGGAFSGMYDPVVNASGAYTYTVNGVAPCPNDQATVTVTENTSPNAGSDGSLTVCSTDAPFGLFAALGGAQAGGTWTAPGGGPFSGTYDPAVNAPGAYTYTVNGAAPCPNDQATVTVSENTAPNAGTDGSITLCSNGAPIILLASLAGAQAGGTWTGSGGGAFGGMYDPAADAAGVYTYTVNGAAPCANDQATVTVSENIAPDAGVDGAITVCDVGGSVNLFSAVGGTPMAGGGWTDPGGAMFSGTYDPTVDIPGTYTYTLAGAAPCANDQATVAVTVTGSPDAGGDGSIVLCSDASSVALFTLLSAADPGGSWTAPGGIPHSGSLDPLVDASGIYVYDLVAIAPCISDQSVVTVTIVPAPDAGGDASITVCDAGAPIALFGALSGSPDAGGIWFDPGGAACGGTYDPTVDGPGVFTYTVGAAAPCVSDQATITVSESTSPSAGLDGAISECSDAAPSSLFAQLTGADPGGAWTGPGGLPHTGTLDPSVDPSGIYTYVVSTGAPCSPDQAVVMVTVDMAPDAGQDNSVQVCAGDPPFLLFTLLAGTPDAGGSWTDPMGAPSTGTFDPSASPAGVYTYTVANGTCAPDQSTVTMTYSAGPNAGLDNAVALCETGPVVNMLGLLGGSPDPGGIWTDSGGSVVSGSFDPSSGAGGSFTYTLTGVGTCTTAWAQLTIAVNAATTAGAPGSATFCGNGPPAALFAYIVGSPAPGGTWTGPGGGAFNGTFDPTSDPSGGYTYTVTGTAPCPSVSTTVDVTVITPADAGGDASASLCETDPPVVMTSLLGGTPQPGGIWTDPLGAIVGGTFDPATGPMGIYTYDVAGIGPCLSDQSLLALGVGDAASAGTDGAITVCDNAAAFDLFAQLGGAPDPGGFWTDAMGNVVPDLFDPSSDAPGALLYTVDGTAPCPQDQAIVQVDVVEIPEPVITVITESGCAPVLASFTTDHLGGGTFSWVFGNGTTSSDPDPDSVLFTVAGSYAVALTIDPGFGCASTTVLSPGLVVSDEPLAAFTFSPGLITTSNAEVSFQDASQGASMWSWDFAGLGTAQEEDPTFTFPEAEEGDYDVCLTAYSSPLCFDTVCHRITVLMGPTIYTPNTFTPDGDGVNDSFGPSVMGVTGFRFRIFDRWGRPLFETTDPAVRWDGSFPGGERVPEGVYVWELTAEDPHHPETFERRGHVTLLR